MAPTSTRVPVACCNQHSIHSLAACITCLQQGILDKYNVELIGAKLPSIDKAEDRDLFKQVCPSGFRSRSASSHA